mgnify:CR=1 FL=1
MDETDLFGKSKKKHDKADATATAYTGPDATRYPNASENYVKKPINSIATNEEYYNNNNPRAGVALILNHKDVKGQKQRVGTEEDRDKLKQTLLRYGFDVRVYNDLSFAEVSEMLKASKYHKLT